MKNLDVESLRAELFLMMLVRRGESQDLMDVSSEEAALMGEHAARLAKAALDGIGYYDRTGQVRDPRPRNPPPSD